MRWRHGAPPNGDDDWRPDKRAALRRRMAQDSVQQTANQPEHGARRWPSLSRRCWDAGCFGRQSSSAPILPPTALSAAVRRKNRASLLLLCSAPSTVRRLRITASGHRPGTRSTTPLIPVDSPADRQSHDASPPFHGQETFRVRSHTRPQPTATSSPSSRSHRVRKRSHKYSCCPRVVVIEPLPLLHPIAAENKRSADKEPADKPIS